MYNYSICHTNRPQSIIIANPIQLSQDRVFIWLSQERRPTRYILIALIISHFTFSLGACLGTPATYACTYISISWSHWDPIPPGSSRVVSWGAPERTNRSSTGIIVCLWGTFLPWLISGPVTVQWRFLAHLLPITENLTHPKLCETRSTVLDLCKPPKKAFL